jgi:hypothetical protein
VSGFLWVFLGYKLVAEIWHKFWQERGVKIGWKLVVEKKGFWSGGKWVEWKW